jgi:hypothetical protein
VKGKKLAGVVALALATGLMGYLLGPPVADAVTNFVVIKSGKSGSTAKVNRAGRLLSDTEFDAIKGAVAAHIVGGTASEFGPLDCQMNDPKRGSGQFEDIFDGRAVSAKWDVSVTCTGDCTGATVQCVGGGGDSGFVGKNKSKTIGCLGDAGNPITDAYIWCTGPSGTCSGTFSGVS